MNFLNKLKKQLTYKYDSVMGYLAGILGDKFINFISTAGYKKRKQMLAEFGEGLSVTFKLKDDVVNWLKQNSPETHKARELIFETIKVNPIRLVVNNKPVVIDEGVLSLFEVDALLTLSKIKYGNKDFLLSAFANTYATHFRNLNFDVNSYCQHCLFLGTNYSEEDMSNPENTYIYWVMYLKHIEAKTGIRYKEFTNTAYVLDAIWERE